MIAARIPVPLVLSNPARLDYTACEKSFQSRQPEWELRHLALCCLEFSFHALPGVEILGLKGAACAALGERPGVFEDPLTPRVAGVKLGESALNLFLTLEN